MKKILLAAMVAVLAGCVSSGPVLMGKDTYMISKQSPGGLMMSTSNIKIEIIREAHTFCASQNKLLQVTNTSEVTELPVIRLPSAEVQFMCLDANDRQLARPMAHHQPLR